MKQAMKRMGIRQEDIDASEVIIRTSGKDIIIRNPQVARVNMAGQVSYQISGEEVEVSSAVSDDDVKTVAEQAGVSEEKAKLALEETGGDLAEAILRLKS